MIYYFETNSMWSVVEAETKAKATRYAKDYFLGMCVTVRRAEKAEIDYYLRRYKEIPEA